jgi:hypothetical protein
LKKYLSILVFATTGLISAAPTVSVTQTGVGNPAVTANVPNIGDVYIGPYQLDINGTIVNALCVDPIHESNPGDSWTANVSTVGGNISNTYNAGNTAKVLGYSLSSSYGYEIDAILFDMIEQPGSDRTTLQEAAWSLFDPTLFGSDTAAIQDAAYQDFLKSGINLNTFDFSDYQILTDVNGSKQEFLVSSAPEPASWLLLLSGALMLGIGVIRRKPANAGA